jgi:hypothetical protein
MKHQIKALVQEMHALRGSARRMNELLLQISAMVAAQPVGCDIASPGSGKTDLDRATQQVAEVDRLVAQADR